MVVDRSGSEHDGLWVFAYDARGVVLGKVVEVEGRPAIEFMTPGLRLGEDKKFITCVEQAVLLKLCPAYDYFGVMQPNPQGFLHQMLAYPMAAASDELPTTVRPCRVVPIVEPNLLAHVFRVCVQAGAEIGAKVREAMSPLKIAGPGQMPPAPDKIKLQQ